MPAIPIGTTFTGPDNETFEVTDFLGRGAFGEVYRASGRVSGSVVAVKLLPIDVLPSTESRAALMNEVRAALDVKHPNVVQALYANDGTSSVIGPYVVMEYVSGGTLAKLLRSQAQSARLIPLPRAVEMMIDLGQGARAVNQKVVHRDIKPDNILIEGSVLKIGDFGISKFVDESTRLHTFKGGQHIAYMAPEGWEGLANTFKLDVYSVGLVFYQILTLKHPLLGKIKDPDNFRDWEKAHLYHPCPDVRSMRSDVPLSIAQLLSRMVSKRPDDRPNWDDILKLLSQPEIDGTIVHPSVTAAVEAAMAREEQERKKHLEIMAQESEAEKRLGRYRYSCDTLLARLDPLVEQFNRQFQHGQITRDDTGWGITYRVPQGDNISVSFFQPRDSGIRIRTGEVIGGGWIGLTHGRSANLVLLRHSTDDLYGQWAICEIGIMALADARKLIGQFGIMASTVVPFGFKDAYFYDQIQYATGTVHVFTTTSRMTLKRSLQICSVRPTNRFL
jgi:eukaryotic-like serine/threonine-protein kinase